jgi:hypothetical protein
MTAGARTAEACAIEPGSFRDRHARVFYAAGATYRGLSARALQEWQALAATGFVRRFTVAGKLIPTEQIDPARLPPRAFDENWVGVLKHQTVPFISYPYEWCFGMLRDAALLHLELLEAALAEGMTLKDATPYNVQWRGARSVFIDIPSFVRLAAGEPWLGYRQFCQTFLYPLFLQAFRGVPFQPWLRGSLDGISAEQCDRLLSWRDRLRPGVFLHAYLQARLQAGHAGSRRDVRRDLRAAGFDRRLIVANVRGLRRVIERLPAPADAGGWQGYEDNPPYGPGDRERKEAFVRGALSSRRWGLVWDLGCHTGSFARMAGGHARRVVALDRDVPAVERLYQRLKAEGNASVLPLVGDLADASPNLGWRGLERKALEERGRPDLTLCLALLHHVVLGANIPLGEFIDWLAGLGTSLVIEFVTRDDPMVRALLRHKEDQYADYDLGFFERCLGRAFDVARREALNAGRRLLYFARPRA